MVVQRPGTRCTVPDVKGKTQDDATPRSSSRAQVGSIPRRTTRTSRRARSSPATRPPAQRGRKGTTVNLVGRERHRSSSPTSWARRCRQADEHAERAGPRRRRDIADAQPGAGRSASVIAQNPRHGPRAGRRAPSTISVDDGPRQHADATPPDARPTASSRAVVTPDRRLDLISRAPSGRYRLGECRPVRRGSAPDERGQPGGAADRLVVAADLAASWPAAGGRPR